MHSSLELMGLAVLILVLFVCGEHMCSHITPTGKTTPSLLDKMVESRCDN